MSNIKYKRILLKVSGEALGEKTERGDGFGLNFKKIDEVCLAIKECVQMGVQVGLVIGGGNFGVVLRTVRVRCSVLMLMPWACWPPL